MVYNQLDYLNVKDDMISIHFLEYFLIHGLKDINLLS